MKQAKEAKAYSAMKHDRAEVAMIEEDDEFYNDMQEAAELGILHRTRRYVSHKVRKHPFDM